MRVRGGPLSIPKTVRLSSGGARRGLRRARARGGCGPGLRLQGTDLDNPSSGQAPASCPQGLIPGQSGKVRGLQRGGWTGLAQLWVEKRMASGGQPRPLLPSGAGPTAGPQDSQGPAGAEKARTRGMRLPRVPGKMLREGRQGLE